MPRSAAAATLPRSNAIMHAPVGTFRANAFGLHDVLGRYGRLTNRNMELGPECEDPIPFGKFRGTPMKDVPFGYLQWFLTNAERRDEQWRAIWFEVQRRLYFGPAETAEGAA